MILKFTNYYIVIAGSKIILNASTLEFGAITF